MPPDTTFTPQQVINTARQRHPALHALVLDDEELLEDYNAAVRELFKAVRTAKPSALMTRTADLAMVGADGSLQPLEFSEGRMVGLPNSLEAVTALGRFRVHTNTDIEQREAMRREFVDDGRPAGIYLNDVVNNRYQVLQVVNWTGVTAIAAFATFFPVEVVVGTINNAVLIRYSFFKPLVEELAYILAHRADISAEWMTMQEKKIGDAVQVALGEFAAV